MTPDTRYALEMKYIWMPFFYSQLSSRASASVQAGTSTNSDLNVSPASQTKGNEITEDPSASGRDDVKKEATLLRAKEAQPGLGVFPVDAIVKLRPGF